MYFYIGRRINKFDNYILFIIKNYGHNKFLDIIMPLATLMGNLGIIWIAIAMSLILNKPYRAIGDSLILTLIIATIVGEGIVKHIVKRVRPCNTGKLMTYSFPSGHTLSSFAAAEMLSMHFNQYKFLFMAIAFLIALSRLYLYVHYPTDVIAGIIIGILCSKVAFIVLQKGYIEKLAFFVRI